MFAILKRIIAWLPVLWRDEDWDYAYLIYIIRFKLNRMQQTLEQNNITTSCKQDARRIRTVIEHFKRFEDICDYTKPPACYYKQLNSLEQWHWNEAWRIIAKYGQGWWD